jgi:hypothetical protein
MLTDDPGTPGANHWEINLGWTTQRTPGSTEDALPQLDINYGIGDRIELTYFANYFDLRNDGRSATWGLSDSEIAVKWRFFDHGENGLQISVYPQINFLLPGSDSYARGLADRTPSYELPFELQRAFKYLSVGIDCGHFFARQRNEDRWFGGLCVGKEVIKGWELDAEVHLETDARAGRAEEIADGATRIDLSEKYTLMFLLGRDLGSQLGPRISLLSYVGLQMRF